MESRQQHQQRHDAADSDDSDEIARILALSRMEYENVNAHSMDEQTQLAMYLSLQEQTDILQLQHALNVSNPPPVITHSTATLPAAPTIKATLPATAAAKTTIKATLPATAAAAKTTAKATLPAAPIIKATLPAEVTAKATMKATAKATLPAAPTIKATLPPTTAAAAAKTTLPAMDELADTVATRKHRYSQKKDAKLAQLRAARIKKFSVATSADDSVV
jgi:hypothetical protein